MTRPKIITFICIIGYLSVLFSFPQVFSPSVKKLGLFVPAIYGIVVAGQFIGCVGLWYYKRWGAELFALAFFARVIFHLLSDGTGAGMMVSAMINVTFLIILLRHYPRMSRNL